MLNSTNEHQEIYGGAALRLNCRRDTKSQQVVGATRIVPGLYALADMKPAGVRDSSVRPPKEVNRL